MLTGNFCFVFTQWNTFICLIQGCLGFKRVNKKMDSLQCRSVIQLIKLIALAFINIKYLTSEWRTIQWKCIKINVSCSIYNLWNICIIGIQICRCSYSNNCKTIQHNYGFSCKTTQTIKVSLNYRHCIRTIIWKKKRFNMTTLYKTKNTRCKLSCEKKISIKLNWNVCRTFVPKVTYFKASDNHWPRQLSGRLRDEQEGLLLAVIVWREALPCSNMASNLNTA